MSAGSKGESLSGSCLNTVNILRLRINISVDVPNDQLNLKRLHLHLCIDRTT